MIKIVAAIKNMLGTILGKAKPFKNDKKCFLFQVESSFCSEVILSFVLIFSGHVEIRLDKEAKGISKV